MTNDITDKCHNPLYWPKGSKPTGLHKGEERRGPAEKSLDRYEKHQAYCKHKPTWKPGTWITGCSVLNLELGREGVRGYDKAHNAVQEEEEQTTGRGHSAFRGMWARVRDMWRAIRYGGGSGRINDMLDLSRDA